MKELKSGINDFCEMTDMPGLGLEIFKTGGGCRDQQGAPSWSTKLLFLRQGRVRALPMLFGQIERRLLEPEVGQAYDDN
ncbi:hypothetical protein T05_7475 [Trichinella murrelli]|uniref:Uncharacterized protein n=2 Tax=Trichinella murrelli TaxID=144512 RepID=A0A0V0T6I7_9BILA|nr:hypothetical protein T05_7475 [Trichinella murrelli]